MSVAEQSIAAATAVVGFDLLENDVNNLANMDRFVKRAGLAGSAAALDTQVELFFGREKVADMFNVATGAVLSDAHFRDISKVLRSGVQVRALVKDAPSTNPINIVVEFAD